MEKMVPVSIARLRTKHCLPESAASGRRRLTRPAPASHSHPSSRASGAFMAVRFLEEDFPTDHLPLLRWLIFSGVCLFGFVLAWYFGLFRLMLASDKTYISLVI